MSAHELCGDRSLVHDSQVAVPLMKKTRETADFWYALLDKGYISPVINDYVDMIGGGRPSSNRRAYKGVVAAPWTLLPRNGMPQEPPWNGPIASSRMDFFPIPSISEVLVHGMRFPSPFCSPR